MPCALRPKRPRKGDGGVGNHKRRALIERHGTLIDVTAAPSIGRPGRKPDAAVALAGASWRLWWELSLRGGTACLQRGGQADAFRHAAGARGPAAARLGGSSSGQYRRHEQRPTPSSSVPPSSTVKWATCPPRRRADAAGLHGPDAELARGRGAVLFARRSSCSRSHNVRARSPPPIPRNCASNPISAGPRPRRPPERRR